MAIQYKFIVIPVKGFCDAEEELNRFVASHRVVGVHREFVNWAENSFWALAVEYLCPEEGVDKRGGKAKVDYKEMLSAEDFALFAKLREWRKTVADGESVPVYTVFTNEQLAEVAMKRVVSKAGLHEIPGVGDARVRKYGDDVISIVKAYGELAGLEKGRPSV